MHPRLARQTHLSLPRMAVHTSGLNTAVPSYNPNSCRSIWVSYVKADLQNLTEWRSRVADFDDYFGPEVTMNITSTSYEPILTPAPQQCDDFRRSKSIGEITKTIVTTDRKVYWHDREGNIYDPSDFGLLPEPAPYPKCSIHPEDCETQWSLFGDAFANWTARADTLVATGHTDPGMCEMHPMNCLSANMFNIDAWVGFRHYTSRPGFFDSCHEPIQLCENNLGHMGYRVGSTPGSQMRETEIQCAVDFDRFVLIYFPPALNNSASMCDLNANISKAVSNEHLDSPITASLTDITFHARPSRFGIEYTSESVMTGNWTFTSPSVYLAYGTLAAYGGCINKIVRENGILTLQPSELSSVAFGSSTRLSSGHHVNPGHLQRPADLYNLTTKSFNLADLHGPVPGRAYFSGIPCDKEVIVGHDEPSILRCDDTIVENAYFPMIAVPAQVTELDSQLASCYPFVSLGKTYATPLILGVWDPPSALPVARSIATISHLPPVFTNMIEPSALPIVSDMIGMATPGPSPSRPHASATMDTKPVQNSYRTQIPIASESKHSPDTSKDGSVPIESQILNTLGRTTTGTLSAVLTVDQRKFVVSRIANSEDLQIGSNILRVGGPAVVISGLKVSLAGGRNLVVGDAHTIDTSNLTWEKVSSEEVLLDANDRAFPSMRMGISSCPRQGEYYDSSNTETLPGLEPETTSSPFEYSKSKKKSAAHERAKERLSSCRILFVLLLVDYLITWL